MYHRRFSATYGRSADHMNVVFDTARGGACGFVKAVRVRGSGFGCPLRGGRRKTPRKTIPESPSLETWARKGSMEQSVHRPLSQSCLPIVRRVNSAAGERVGLDLLRRPRRPVVTACYIDPPTRSIPNRPRCCGGAHVRAWRFAECGCGGAR